MSMARHVSRYHDGSTRFASRAAFDRLSMITLSVSKGEEPKGER
jgi:hypothetical protein